MVDDQDNRELVADFWKSLKASRTVMLGVVGAQDGATRPMTAQLREVDGADTDPEIFFFASRSEGVGSDVLATAGARAIAAFSAEDHGIFASIHGPLNIVEDRATIDELWSPMAGIYYMDGRGDPDLLLLRLDAGDVSLWRSDTSGFLKSITYKVMGRDAGRANPEDRADVTL